MYRITLNLFILQSAMNNITKYNQKYLKNNNNIYNLHHRHPLKKNFNKTIKIDINRNNYKIRYRLLSTNAKVINHILDNCFNLSVRIIKDITMWII
jgi:hypothetical protein